MVLFIINESMTNWSTAICLTNRINLYYTRTGGKKPSLILLHGLTGSGACWTPVAQALEEEYDVIMPDARGHGKSSMPDDGYQYEDHANDVVGLIEALGLSHPIVIGHSMGGLTAALIASRKPRLLRGLILADPAFLNPEYQREVYESDVASYGMDEDPNFTITYQYANGGTCTISAKGKFNGWGGMESFWPDNAVTVNGTCSVSFDGKQTCTVEVNPTS